MANASLRSYECSVYGFASVIDAPTAGKARYQYLLDVSDCFPDVQFKDIRIRSLGPVQPSLEERRRDAFNAQHPVGTLCLFWPGLREGIGCLARTRTTAQMMSDHASVWFEQHCGSICLSHVEPVAGGL